MPTLSSPSPWREAWSRSEDAVYLNLAGQAPMPAASLESARTALEWKAFPQLLSDQAERDLTERVRGLLAHLIGADSRQVAVTTGASAGLAALAYGLDWKPGDEILTACREFPVQYTTWRPMEAREGVSLKLVSPAGKWITAENLIAALRPRTRVVSVSLVRFDDGSLLDAAKLSAACHARGVVVALDVSQACGAIPMDVRTLGADFLTCAGYKWLLGPYGTGFFWVRPELQATFRPSPFYWQGIDGLNDFFQARGVGDFSEISPENWRRDGGNAYPAVDGAASRIFAAGSLPVDESAGAGAARTARMFFRPQLRRDQIDVRALASRENIPEPARDQHPRFYASVHDARRYR